MKKILYLFLTVSLIFSSCAKEEGCTDSQATNYNSDAEEEDESCTYSLVGVWNMTSTSITGIGELGDQFIEEYYFYSNGNWSAVTIPSGETTIMSFGSYTSSGSSLNITYANTDGQSGTIITTITQINGNTMSFEALDYPENGYTTSKSYSKSNMDLPNWNPGLFGL